jgi:hypothetical protein
MTITAAWADDHGWSLLVLAYRDRIKDISVQTGRDGSLFKTSLFL